jgi:hypothetical protein
MTEWHDIPGWPYQINRAGQVRSLPRIVIKSNGTVQNVKGRILKPYTRAWRSRATMKCRHQRVGVGLAALRDGQTVDMLD